MVGFKNMGWHSADSKKKSQQQLGILAFETGKTISRLISIYKSLSDEEMSRLRKVVVKSQGIAFLNSIDEGFLLNLALAERLEDLDRAAVSISRLGKKCNDVGLNRFDLVYTDLKLGIFDFGKLEYGSRLIERKVQKMEKLVSTTSSLHASLEELTEMEISHRKMHQFKNKVQVQMKDANFDILNQKLEFQRKEVKNLKEISLWSKGFDKTVGIMARIVCVVYARICFVFGSYIPPVLPLQIIPIKEQILPHSGPILSSMKPNIIRFYSQKCLFNQGDTLKNNMVFHTAGPSTLGGSGLALRYANVIILAEKYLDCTDIIDHDQRQSFYQMLPENLKALVRSKLSKNMKSAEDDACLAEGWREAMIEMMLWLAPMAHNTVKWQMERTFDKVKFNAKPSVLLLQTLHFSDKEKTEAAIAEVLVGLSCIYRCENRHLID